MDLSPLAAEAQVPSLNGGEVRAGFLDAKASRDMYSPSGVRDDDRAFARRRGRGQLLSSWRR